MTSFALRAPRLGPAAWLLLSSAAACSAAPGTDGAGGGAPSAFAPLRHEVARRFERYEKKHEARPKKKHLVPPM